MTGTLVLVYRNIIKQYSPSATIYQKYRHNPPPIYSHKLVENTLYIFSPYFPLLNHKMKPIYRIPTKTGKPGKMRRHFPVREKSGNFEQTGKVRENHTKYWKNEKILDKYY